jgi:hypothetical protein
MDWKYKHFNHEAVFGAFGGSVLEAARAVAAESLSNIEDTADGFIARGSSAWHNAVATFHIAPAPEGTRLTIELLVERAAMRGYMLFDVGGYYSIQIDKWFVGIAQRLGSADEQTLVSKTTRDSKIPQGCLMGCFVYLVVGTCLVLLAIPLDQALFPKLSGSAGPFSLLASLLGLLAGIGAFLYVRYPDAPASKSIRERLQSTQNKKRQ